MFCFVLNFLVWLQLLNRLSGINFKQLFLHRFFHKTQKLLTKIFELSQESKNEKLKIYEDIRYLTASHEYSLPSISHTFSAYILSQFYPEHNFLTNDILRHQFLDEATTFNG